MNTFYKLIVAGGLLVVTTSCDKEDWLNPSPTSMLTEDVVFSSEDRIVAMLNGLYATLKDGDFYGTRYPIFSDIRSGDFVSTNLNPNIGALTYLCQVESGSLEVEQVWEQGYQVINACNTFLAGMEKEGNAVVGESAAQYNAEAKAIRALTYYALLQLYAQPYAKDNGSSPGLPLRLAPNVGLADYNLARSSVAEVYGQVLRDFDEAEMAVPDAYGSDLLNTTRIHKNTVRALKVRVYLSMANYPKVKEEAAKLVFGTADFTAAGSGGVVHALEPDIANVFAAPYVTKESIFSLAFTNNDVPGVALGNYYLPLRADAGPTMTTGQGQFYVNAAGTVSSENWSQTDARRGFIFATPSGGQEGRLWLTKFKAPSPFTDYVPVIRYAEVLLAYAEAVLHTDGNAGVPQALALLNAVRHRSDPGYVFAVDGVDDLIAKIWEERQIEFLGEGLSSSDLLRTLRPIPAKNPPGALSVPGVSPDGAQYTWPLPNSELLYNEAI